MESSQKSGWLNFGRGVVESILVESWTRRVPNFAIGEFLSTMVCMNSFLSVNFLFQTHKIFVLQKICLKEICRLKKAFRVTLRNP